MERSVIARLPTEASAASARMASRTSQDASRMIRLSAGSCKGGGKPQWACTRGSCVQQLAGRTVRH
eukprot:9335506-Alexandrium_andersonii.AAC.1